MKKTLLDTLTDWLDAISGGRDSTVLLHSLNHLKKKSKKSFSLEAWHVNHQLQPEAMAWVKQCANFCIEQNIPFRFFEVTVGEKRGESLEAAARMARYQVFLDNISPHNILVTAHHQQDNVETFLHHALRGAGVRGLRGIAPWKPFGDQSFFGSFNRADCRVCLSAGVGLDFRSLESKPTL
jgi:tRNA(Ile)-lysidine synthase